MMGYGPMKESDSGARAPGGYPTTLSGAARVPFQRLSSSTGENRVALCSAVPLGDAYVDASDPGASSEGAYVYASVEVGPSEVVAGYSGYDWNATADLYIVGSDSLVGMAGVYYTGGLC